MFLLETTSIKYCNLLKKTDYPTTGEQLKDCQKSKISFEIKISEEDRTNLNYTV